MSAPGKAGAIQPVRRREFIILIGGAAAVPRGLLSPFARRERKITREVSCVHWS
jgi:hypothetical protein